MSGIKFMGKDPNGNAKAISTDAVGNLSTVNFPNQSKLIYSGVIGDGETKESDVFDVDVMDHMVSYFNNTAHLSFRIEAVYLLANGKEITTTVISEKLPTATSGVIGFISAYSRVKFKITNNTGAARTIRFEFSQSRRQPSISVSKSKLRKITTFPLITAPYQEITVLCEDFVFDLGTTAWGLYWFGTNNRSIEQAIDFVRIRVEFTGVLEPNRYSPADGTRMIFRKDFSLSLLDEFDKALIVDSQNTFNEESSRVFSVILAGKYVNFPIGEYMRLSIINLSPVARTFSLSGLTIVEEGNY